MNEKSLPTLNNNLSVGSAPALGTSTSNNLSLYLDPVLFEQGMKAAEVLAQSGILPAIYQKSTASCFLLLAMASELSMSPIMLAQKTYIVNGKFAFEAQLVIAMANKSGRIAKPLSWQYSGSGMDRAVMCVAARKEDGLELSAECSIKMAVEYGWYAKSGSHWPKIPDQMLAYRSAVFLIRRYMPEILFGMHTVDEAYDMEDVIDIDFVSHEISSTSFEQAMQERGVSVDDPQLLTFMQNIAQQNRVSLDALKSEAAREADSFIAGFNSWREKNSSTKKVDTKKEKTPDTPPQEPKADSKTLQKLNIEMGKIAATRDDKMKTINAWLAEDGQPPIPTSKDLTEAQAIKYTARAATEKKTKQPESGVHCPNQNQLVMPSMECNNGCPHRKGCRAFDE